MEVASGFGQMVSMSIGEHKCRFCSSAFGSRNLVFAHLRSSEVCAAKAREQDPRSAAAIFTSQAKRQFATVLVGYTGGSYDGDTVEGLVSSIVGTDGCTRASASKGRGRSSALTQEAGCAAARDVLCVAVPESTPMDVEWLNSRLPQEVRALAVTRGRKMHAEADCGQRAYHYLLPVRWIGIDSDSLERDLERQVSDDDEEVESQRGRNFGFGREHVPRRISFSKPTLLAMKRLKKALNAVAKDLKTAAFHNFADPTLGGAASPFAAAVQMRIEQAKGSEFVRVDGELHVIVELRAAGFVAQQVRRVVAAAVLMQRGALPDDYMWLATRREAVVETPLAPAGRLYFAGARYYGDEIRLIETFPDEDEEVTKKWTLDFREALLRQGSTRETEDAWLSDVEQNWAPQLAPQLAELRKHMRELEASAASSSVRKQEGSSTTKVVAKPQRGKESRVDVAELSPERRAELNEAASYDSVLGALQAASNGGSWPATTAARAKLIEDGGGSFTVTAKGKGLGDALFPELSALIFALEKKVTPSDRIGSTHCAVNKMAQFAPHVDSGSGEGQSLSTIVGLGDYTGGSLMVEGKEHDVRYAPLEFDGWRQRHWTLPYTGERFSLVWFTPAKPKTWVEARALEVSRGLLTYRKGSTDADAIVEVLDQQCYAQVPDRLLKKFPDWTARGKVVLDGGAHIGLFSRFLLKNAEPSKIVAFEPEESNALLYEANLKNYKNAQLIQAALVATNAGSRTLVMGRDRSRDGAKNTWRHSLEECSHYLEDDVLLRREVVEARTLESVLADDDFHLVKLDLEGAERQILLSPKPIGWRNVRRLIFEWSFTKDRAMQPFFAAIGRLEQQGFEVAYDGQGVKDQADFWPLQKPQTDLLVFAARDDIIRDEHDDDAATPSSY